ncbi:succinylglutamate-semialdehyde dehydrogenase [Pseudomaricurvus sp.]|uniref:succinylglutamate-semialdehyde dehydrogenase n=1 Tax=Pseudomaricurvus sp. TaxID=2004510 RepID=UPI003F6D22B2
MTVTDISSLFIQSEWQVGKGKLFESLNPINNQVIWRKAGASADQVNAAVNAAQRSQQSWAMVSLEERMTIVQCFAQLLQENRADLALAISLETGKPDWEALAEVDAMSKKIDISCRALQQRAGSQTKNNLQLEHRPHGVMAVFGPYNFPGHLPNGHIVPALLAGNCVVFKPSEKTPLVAEKTVKLWQEAGLPSGVLNLLQGGKEVGALLSESTIDGLLFTGSSTVGRLLHRQMSDRPEVLLALEMGGNNALIVDKNINLDAAINIILHSAYLSAGQRCTCARRLIVVESEQTDEILCQLKQTIEQVIVGAHNDTPEPFMGPVIDWETAKRLLDEQKRLQLAGAEVIASLQSEATESNLLRPALLDVTQLKDRGDDEWFGPLLQLIRVKNFDEAMREANNTRFGLAAGLISDNVEHQRIFCAGIRAGVVSINSPTAGASSEMPFGGVGASGNHRPSAYYAADYCAWPQAQTHGLATSLQSTLSVRGIR